MSVVPVSVVIPFYNGHSFLRRALASIEAQETRPAEVVIVDDGSRDPVRLRRRDDGLVRVVRHPRNLGIPQARNTGVSNARHEWIAFLDQDDEWLPQKLRRQWEAAEQCSDPASVVFYTQAARYVGGTSVRWPTRRAIARLGRSPGAALRTLLLRGNQVPIITMLIHRSALARAGGFDERWRGGADDYALCLALAAQGVVFHGIPLTLAVRHETGENYSSPDAFLQDDTAIVAALSERYPAVRDLRHAALSAAHFRCARGIAGREPARARELFDIAIKLSPTALRPRLGRALLRVAGGAADVLSDTRHRLLAGVRLDSRR